MKNKLSEAALLRVIRKLGYKTVLPYGRHMLIECSNKHNAACVKKALRCYGNRNIFTQSFTKQYTRVGVQSATPARLEYLLRINKQVKVLNIT